MTERTTCRICDSPDLEVFLKLGDLPHSDGLIRPEDLDKPEPRYPLDVAFCRECSLVQILKTVPPEELFGDDYPYFSSFSDALLEHSRKNVEAIIAQRNVSSDQLVIELASNDGYLLQFYQKQGIPVLGIDPAAGPVKAAREKGIETIHDFFTLDLAKRLAAEGRSAHVIHGNNVLAHVADTNGFVQGIATLLHPDGVAVIECPYVRDLIDHCEFDTIYHEHLCYFSVTALVELFRRNGLHLNDVAPLAIHGGSLRLFVEKADRPSERLKKILVDERECGLTQIDYYRDFSDRVVDVKVKLNELLRGFKAEGKTIVGYGAAAKGAILLNYAGIGTDVLEFVADRNVHKQGRLMPGVHVPIVDPAEILESQPDVVLILPWNFKDEIMKQQAEYRARGGKFVVPIPTPEVVG
ncbi:MAG: class I SAM-dependent methyltransferase [Planctomycetes bacterium]|nr:class I SAM-dependent methyltransferase [Planctomycetota bacterium]